MSRIALLLIDHGSRLKAANWMLFDVVKQIRETRSDLLVFGAHMELARPSIPEGIDWCIKREASHIIAHPYMLSPGRHATKDIPEMVADAMARYPRVTFEVTAPLGVDELLVSLVLKRSGLQSNGV